MSNLASVVLRDFLLTKPAVLALFADRVWGEVAYPPKEYTPTQGPGICLKVRGGVGEDETDAVSVQSVQLKVYAEDELGASVAEDVVRTALLEPCREPLKGARREVPPVVLREPESQWVYSLSYVSILFSL